MYGRLCYDLQSWCKDEQTGKSLSSRFRKLHDTRRVIQRSGSPNPNSNKKQTLQTEESQSGGKVDIGYHSNIGQTAAAG